jgi:hypothetical protein
MTKRLDDQGPKLADVDPSDCRRGKQDYVSNRMRARIYMSCV